MNYLRRSNRPERRTGRRIFFTFLALVGVLALFVFVPQLFMSSAHTTAGPLWKSGNGFSVALSNVSTYFASKKRLAAENESLKREIQDAQVKSALYSYLEQENRILREFLGTERTYDTQLADVLAPPNQSPFGTIVVGEGRDSGVTEGDVALSMSGVAIGTVSAVTSKTSTITLFSATGQNVPVRVGSDPATYYATGKNNGNFELHVPRDSAVQEGEPVVMINSPHFLLGKVEFKELDETESFNRILFRTPVNFSTLQFIQIVPEEELI